MRELFIYYRLRSIDSAAALEVVNVFQAQLRLQYPQLIARLLRRTDDVDGADARQTWMETYSTDPMRDPAGVTAELQSVIEAKASALLPLLDGTRHTEVFNACVS
jgi:predicted transcriptional regulator